MWTRMKIEVVVILLTVAILSMTGLGVWVARSDSPDTAHFDTAHVVSGFNDSTGWYFAEVPTSNRLAIRLCWAQDEKTTDCWRLYMGDVDRLYLHDGQWGYYDSTCPESVWRAMEISDD